MRNIWGWNLERSKIKISKTIGANYHSSSSCIYYIAPLNFNMKKHQIFTSNDAKIAQFD
jgi:hypothetical protein